VRTHRGLFPWLGALTLVAGAPAEPQQVRSLRPGELARGHGLVVRTHEEGGLRIERRAAGGTETVFQAASVPFRYATGADLPPGRALARPDPPTFTPVRAVIADADADGAAEVFVAWAHPSYSSKAAMPCLYRYSTDPSGKWHGEQVWESPPTARPEITSLAAGNLSGDARPEIVVSVFATPFVVAGYRLSFDGKGWQAVPTRRSHMGMHRVIADLDGDGRAYTLPT
jgi:hypothetical protein